MKINRFIALASIALLVVGAMGFLSYKAFAQTDQPPAATDCNGQDDDDAAEAVETEDIDDVEEECGPQDEDLDEAGEVDTDDVQDEVEDANEAGEFEGVDEADETAPATTAVSADEAQAIAETANPGAATLNVEFDRENGTDIWEVELDNGLDVKVDAGSGVILLTEGRD